MTSIFTSLRDLHTNYCLPAPYKDAQAWLPFKIESYFDRGRSQIHRDHVAPGFAQSSFRRGVELLYWNGIPIARAVEIAAAQSAGGNAGALHAKGWLPSPRDP